MKINEILTETSLGRVWKHFNDDDTAVAILTAFRGSNTYEQNVKRNRSLASQLKSLGYGYFFVDGFWIENMGTPEEQKAPEDSIFVIGRASDSNFVKNIHRLGNEYEQDAVLVKDGKGTRVIFKDGGTKELGKMSPGTLADTYSKISGRNLDPGYTSLRTGKKTNTFVFTEEREDIGWIGRLGSR